MKKQVLMTACVFIFLALLVFVLTLPKSFAALIDRRCGGDITSAVVLCSTDTASPIINSYTLEPDAAKAFVGGLKELDYKLSSVRLLPVKAVKYSDTVFDIRLRKGEKEVLSFTLTDTGEIYTGYMVFKGMAVKELTELIIDERGWVIQGSE